MKVRRTRPDPVAARVGARIRALRHDQGITQEKLAYESGMRSKGNMSDIERGFVVPTLPTLMLIAARLEVDLLDLFTFPDESSRHEVVDLTRRMTTGTLRRLAREARL